MEIYGNDKKKTKKHRKMYNDMRYKNVESNLDSHCHSYSNCYRNDRYKYKIFRTRHILCLIMCVYRRAILAFFRFVSFHFV